MSAPTTSRRNLAALAVVFATLLLALLPAGARGAFDPESELAAAVAAGRLDASVYQAVVTGGSAEGIVIFDDSAIQAQAAALRSSRGVRHDDEAVSAYLRFALAEEKASVSAAPGGRRSILRDYPSFPLQHVAFDSATSLALLLRLSQVTGVASNVQYTTQLAQSLPLVNQPAAETAGYTGAGTSVAIIDTGVDYTKPEFGSCTAPGGSCRVAFSSDIAPNDGQRDDNGHGTNVAAIALGVAPGAKIIGLDVFTQSIFGLTASSSDIIGALNWVYSNRATYNIASTNMSLGDSGKNTSQCSINNPYLSVITNLRNAGILSAIASGNNAYTNAISSPGCTPGAISVGAVYDSNMGAKGWSVCTDSTTAADKVTCFSNSASYLSLLAPGSVISAAGFNYSGTSQATPHAAGAIAVLRGANSAATAAQLETALTGAGPNVTDARNGITKHRLDVCAAVNAAGQSCTPPATAAPACYWLNVLGSGSGTVSSPVPANSVGCAAGRYTSGAQVSLSATPTDPSGTVSWSAVAGAFSTPSGASTTYTMPAQSVTVTAAFGGPPPAGPSFFFSLRVNAILSGISMSNQDIIGYNGVSYSKYFDGSDVGLLNFIIDAFDILPDGSILLSFTSDGNIGAVGLVDESDIVRFTPTSLGENTAGSFSLFFDGSDIGLTTSSEDIDAVSWDGTNLYLSTVASFSAGGVSGADHDVFVCNGAVTGAASSCSSLATWFDGDDVGLTTSSEDIDGLAIGADGTIYLSTTGSFNVLGLTGANEDVFACNGAVTGNTTSCASWSMNFDGSAKGLPSSSDIAAIDFGP